MLYIPFPFKRCPTCNILKPFAAFGKNKCRSDGLQTRCKVCRKEFRDRHKDNINAANRRYFVEHRDELNARARDDRRSNPEKYRKRDRKRYQRDREKRLACIRRSRDPEKRRKNKRGHYARHREIESKKRRLYKREHRTQATISTQRHRAAKRQLPATFTTLDWKRALEYFGGCCAYCGRPPGFWRTLARDHFIPQAKGGGYTPENILPACHGDDGCNNTKSARDPVEWLNEKFGKRKAKQILKRIQDYFDSLKQD